MIIDRNDRGISGTDEKGFETLSERANEESEYPDSEKERKQLLTPLHPLTIRLEHINSSTSRGIQS